MPPAPLSRTVRAAAAALLLGATTGCSLLAAPNAEPPGTPAPVSPRQVVLTAAQTLDDSGGARIAVLQEGPAGRRTAGGTLTWGARDEGALTVTDELGTGRLTVRDGVLDLAYQGGAVKHGDRAAAESLDPATAAGAAPAPWAGGWMTALVTNPGSRAYAVGQTAKLSSLGGEDLGGTTVAHYRGTVEVAELFGADGELSPQQLAATVGWYQGRGVATLGYDLWVGPGDRLLRMRETATGAAGTTVTTTDVGPAEESADPAPEATG
ncbi:hypothetical protein ACIBCA_11675 [Kitasatospora sp. NPDC051170]|uniref:hypothetical protein n=1 Tax=Kitasatospora sp. NPDC051170 TaxID=3364056 RepID=UPI0037AB28D8